MNKPAAFRAVYSDWRLVKTRGVVQIVLEVPVEQSNAVLDVLGGMPLAGKEQWFGVAAIKEREVMPTDATHRPTDTRPQPDKQAGAKRDWRNLAPSTQAGIRCEEPTFAAFLKEQHSEDWRESKDDAAECVRLICGVQSRSELNTNHAARVIWHQLDDQFGAWKQVEHA